MVVIITSINYQINTRKQVTLTYQRSHFHFRSQRVQENSFTLCKIPQNGTFEGGSYFGKSCSIKFGLVAPHFEYIVALKS